LLIFLTQGRKGPSLCFDHARTAWVDLEHLHGDTSGQIVVTRFDHAFNGVGHLGIRQPKVLLMSQYLVFMRNHRAVRSHIGAVRAIALCNIHELAAG
jgi:hypothetical protein